MTSKMNEKAFSFLSNISLNPKTKPPSSSSSSSSPASNETKDSNDNLSTKPSKSTSSSSSTKSRKANSSATSSTTPSESPDQQIFLTNYTSKAITSKDHRTSNKQTWIYNLPSATYRSINPAVGSTVTLNCKQKNLLLKRGDQFYFSTIIPTKVDRIVALATVTQEPQPSPTEKGTYIVILTFDKLFPEPIPRDYFSSSTQLSNIVRSTSTFTNISDTQLPVFINILNSYSIRKKPIKEAKNFLSGISLAPTTQAVTAQPQSSSTSSNATTQQQNDSNANNSNTVNPNNSIQNSPSIAESSLNNGNNAASTSSHPIQQQAQQQQPQQQSQSQLINQPYRKKNTIEDYNASYNLSMSQRVFFTTSSGYPISVFSMIKGDTRKQKVKGKNTSKEPDPISPAGDTLIGVLSKESNFFKLKETSYAHLLPSTYISPSDDVSNSAAAGMIKYDPLFLDNSELKTGKHRTVMNLPGYKISILPYIKKGAIKEELNEQFRQKHEWIQTGVTLYKIRKIKRQLKKVALLADIEMSTVALSYVLIEKLIIKSIMTKANFKLYAAGCLLLAAKFNDPKALESLLPLIENIEKKFSITKKELLSNEFHIYSQVSFGLFVDYHDVWPHYMRLRCEILNDSSYDPSVPSPFVQ